MTLAQGPGFGFSPDSSSPEMDVHNGSLLFDDDSKDGLFDDEKPIKRSSNGRKGPEAAGKRAQHNAIERARRESLNGRFMTLAEALPSMANVKRPSKSIIVNKALDFVFDAQVKEHALIKENNELRRQVDQLRARLGMAPLPPPTPLPAAAGRAAGAATATPAHIQTNLVAPQPQQMQQYHTSFQSADNYRDEISAAMGGSAGSFDSNSSPGSQPSPHSPASTVSSPNITGYLSSSIEDLAASSAAPVSSGTPVPVVPTSAAPSPFLALQQAQHAAMMQASNFGYMNPALLSQQHTLMLAAQIQAQQQQHHHLHPSHMQNPADLYGWNAFGAGAGAEQSFNTFMS